MLKKQHYITLVLVVLLVVALISLPSRVADRLKLAISGLFLPLIGLAASTHEATAKAGAALTSRAGLAPGKRGQLRSSNQWLLLQVPQAANAFRENEQLRQMLNFRRQKPAWNAPARAG